MIIPLPWGSMVAAAAATTAVATAAATAAATATFVKSQISLQVLKRLLSLLVNFLTNLEKVFAKFGLTVTNQVEILVKCRHFVEILIYSSLSEILVTRKNRSLAQKLQITLEEKTFDPLPKIFARRSHFCKTRLLLP